ncbi:hypothetical protein EYF80_015506 [Liparis tanakae]|uniref:Uncharacterized protein n=1 Tax=Liparis tanakae TaxID=230148 RepID=A0A4Z2IAV2_9TELE|nr:hypothetical protein EYF80_015506 [Liparis tanakae]
MHECEIWQREPEHSDQRRFLSAPPLHLFSTLTVFHSDATQMCCSALGCNLRATYLLVANIEEGDDHKAKRQDFQTPVRKPNDQRRADYGHFLYKIYDTC